MKLFVSIILCAVTFALQAQNTLYIGSATEISVQSQTQWSVVNMAIENHGTVDVQGTLYLKGTQDTERLIHNFNVFTADSLSLDGVDTFLLEGVFTIGDLTLLQMAAAHLVNNASIELNGTITNETNTRFITGDMGSYIHTLRDVTTSDILGNIGVEVVSADADLGMTDVYRRYGSIDIDGQPSILRYYEITPDNNVALNATTRFYYYDADLEGASPDQQNLYRSEDGVNDWTDEGGMFSSAGDAYFLEKTGIEAYSTWAIGANGILPVELIYFDAEATDQNAVLCSWATATEINNDYFEIERSQNGVHFESIGRKKGAGTAHETQRYSLLDRSPYPGDSYYRLKQVDQDGSSSYSAIRSVYIDRSSGIIVYPNPTSEQVNVAIPDKLEVTDYSIYRMNGQVIQSGITNGQNQLELEVSGFTNGAYILELRKEASPVKRIKLIKQ